MRTRTSSAGRPRRSLFSLPRAGMWGCGVGILLGTSCPSPQPQTDPATNEVPSQPVVPGLTAPLAMVVPPDSSGRLFIVDQIGQVRIIDRTGAFLATPFLDIANRMVPLGIDIGGGLIYDERGLLGLAFHPDYATNGRFFVFYTAPKGPEQPASFDSETHVSEFRVSSDNPNIADETSERIMLVVGKPQFNNNGGQLAFGPDGYLYVGIGDGGGTGDNWAGHTGGSGKTADDPHPANARGNAQDKSNLLGKILRIDVDGPEPYGIPTDNPFVEESGVRPEIWAYGFRNPWRFSFDTGEGNRLFCGDVGEDLLEEIDVVTKGGNFGWNIKEGTYCFNQSNPEAPGTECPDTGAGDEPLIDPIIEYPHTSDQGQAIGTAVVGGFVYHGASLPGLAGNYVFADFSTGFPNGRGTVFAAAETSDGVWDLKEMPISMSGDPRVNRFILGVGQDSDGELYLLTSDNLGPVGMTGQVFRVVVAP